MMPTASRFRAVLALSTMVMLLWSWPLWMERAVATFPRVPFVGGITRPLVSLSVGRFVATIAALASTAIGFRPRRAVGLAVVLLAWMVAEDQFRLQPWVYQFFLMGLAMATVPPGRALGLCRLFLVAQYFHSGLSKLDITFCQELGFAFLRTAVGFVGISIESWPAAVRTAAILVMPAGEIAVALGLVFRPSRPYALAGAIALHLGLIVLLSPWGLGHSTIVLMWNLAMIAEILLLFGRIGPHEGMARPARPVGWAERSEPHLPATKAVGLAPLGPPYEGREPRTGMALAIMLAAVLPFGERWGLWDSWPSFALYASHNERMICTVRGGTDRGPGRFLRAGGGPVDAIVDLTAWSLAERRVPIYPQGRALNGVAEALAGRYGGRDSVRVVHLGRADRWTGERPVAEFAGREAIRRRGDSYRLNAHPMR